MIHREDEVLTIVRRVDRTELSAWIEHGWVLPSRQGDACYYTELDVARVRLIAEMRHDLSLDEDAIDVVLPLLDQVYDLRGRLRAVLDALGGESEPVRQRIRARLCPNPES
jgi:chaperone modulatory protein CbpM